MADKKISVTLDIGANINKVKIAAQELQNLFKNTSLDPFKTKNLQNMFNGLNDALTDLEKRSGKALSSLGEGRGIDASKKRVLSYIQNIAQEFQELENLGDTQLSKKIKGLSDSLEQSSKAFDRYEASMKSTKDQAKDLGKQLETLQDIQKKQERLAEIEKNLPNKRRQATRTSNEFDVAAKNLSTAQGNKTRAENRYKKFIEENAIQLTQKGTPKVLSNQKDGITQEQIDKANQLYEAYDKAAKAYAELNKDAQNKQDRRDTATKELTDLENEQKTLKTSLEGVNDTLEETKNKVSQTQEAIKSFNQEGRDTASFEELKKTLKELFGDEIVKDIDNTKEGIQTLKDRIENISTDRVKELRKLFPELFNSIKGLGDSAQTMGKKVDEGLSQFSRANEASQEISHLTSRLKYFFSLAGGFQLMRRAIRSATETTKELDAVMTQTAVVSKFTVGDMWKTLPEYSKYAKQLGTAIKDVYSAQTLYVQQGLSMDKAMDIGIETLKMARVANIDAAEATNSMTAALRGFNMELNETSAQRINDVYSKLAQNTASNTQEISTAMTKTAALANSANMSFENTAAFLATIIESTREGAETAGTALKTVIARFTEVKKLYSEGELTGTDEEGQEVNVNKISAALRTAGINMNDFFTGAKGLDEIFLELGSKWDSLSTVQQRYIATMAAGSRQQSRFLALMQNYNRTVELTQMAYNSAGSGQEQFEKTLDSLQAKIEKFKAEWQTFIMGIANSDAIKGIIDVGTKILEIINKIIDGISGGNGLVKGIASIVTAVGVFKGGRSLTKMIMGGAGNYGLGGIIGNWLGVKNGYGEKQEQAAAFKASMRQGGLRGQRGEFLRTQWFGQGGVLNPKGRVEASKAAIAQAEADAKGYKDAYDKALVQEKEAENKYIDSLDKSSNTQALRGEEYENAQAQTEAARVKYEESQKSLNNIKSSAADAGTAMYQYGQAAKTAGMAAGVAAGACMLLATALDKTGNTKVAKTLRGIGTVLTVLSGVFMVLGQVAQITGAQIAAGAKTASTAIMNIPIIGWIAAIIAALIALGVAISNFVETDAEKAQRLAAETENAKQVAEQASQAYDDLLSAKSGYDELISQLEGLTKGTIEYKNALYEANQQVLELAKNYKDLEYTYDSETGLLKISEESWNKIQERELNRKQSTNAIANLTENREDREKTRQNLLSLRNDYNVNLTRTKRENDLVSQILSINLVEGLNDQELLALKQLGYNKENLQSIYKDATNEEGLNYYQLFARNNGQYVDAKDLSQIYESYLSQVRSLIGDASKTIEDPYKKLDTNIQNSLYAMSDQTKESSYILSKLYNSETFKNIPTVTPGSGRTDWKEKDWNQTAKDINGNIIKDTKGNNKRYWDDIIDTVLKEGLLNETEAATLKSTKVTSNEANKKLYAAITGQKYSDIEDKDIQEVVNYIADYYTSSKMAEQFGIDQKEFEALNPKIQDAFKELVNAPNNLTLEQIETLNEAWSDIGKIGFDKEILNDYYNTLTGLSSNLNFKTDNIEFKKYLSKNLQNQRKELGQWSNGEFLGQYDDLLNSIVTSENFTDTQRGSIINLLSNTNIKSLDDLYKVIDNLKEAGIDLEAQDNNVYNSLIFFAKALGDAGIATKKWSQENAKEAIKNARGIANDKKESQDRKFTKEEFATISELFRGTDYDDELKYFMEQTDGSYKYVGPYLDTIINALYVIANKIPGEQIGSVGGKADLASTIKTKKEIESEDYYKNKEKLSIEVNKAQDKVDTLWNNGATQEEIEEAQKEYNKALANYNNFIINTKQFGTFIPSEDKINDLYKTDSDKANFYNDTIKNLQNLYGITDEDLLKAGLSKEVDASTVGNVWQTLLDILFNPEALEAEVETLRQQIEANSLIGASPTQLANASLGQSIAGYDENGKPIINKEAYTTQSQNLADSALDTALEEENLNEVVERSSEIFKINGKVQEDVGKALKVNALEAKKAEKEFDDLTSVIKDNNTALKSKDPQTRQRALDNIAKAARKAFGNNKKITSKFVEDNEKTFEDYAKGVKGAEDKIRTALGTELANELGMSEDQATNLQKTIDNMANTEFNVDGTADFTDIFNQLLALKLSAEDAASVLSSLGYTVTWVADGVVYDNINDVPIGSDYHVVVTDSAGNAVNRNRNSGGGGGGGKKEFKNDFDKYYNMVEDINELQRLRNLLETDYEQLLKSEAISGKAIYDNLKKQIQLLKERRDITADLTEKRKGQIFETMNDKQYASVRKYAWWNDTDQTIEIDWDAINKVKDSEQGDLIKEYVSKLEGFQSQYDEQIEALEDIESTLQEIQKRGQEEYTSLEDRTRDALIKQIQDKIDELTAVDEAINDTNQKLMDSIQKELEKQRQERENAKTEEELADKEQRLAYLQQDSSGANALEIAKLQEELADARESYTDSLIDQKITELQEQNDEAAQQRQEQIDLMQQSLDWQEKSGAFWEQVYEYIQAGTDEVGTLVHGSELENLLKAGEAWDSLSEEGQMKWLEELENQVAQAIGYLSLSRQLEEIGTKEGTKITFTDAEGNTHTGTVDKNGNVVVKNADGSTTTWKDVYQSYDGSYQTLETQENAQTTPKPATNSGKPSNSGSDGSTIPGSTQPRGKGTDTYEYAGESMHIKHTTYENGDVVNTAEPHNWEIDHKEGEYIFVDICKKCKGRRRRYSPPNSGGGGGGGSWNAVNQKYATGGLADYTGPAWLDGTPSKPELVLNARDTENFIQLKDHLAALRQAGTLNAGGDNYYDIDVHVDSLGSDYDVDMAIDRIKTRLYQDGAYRNVNTLNRLR